MSATFAKKNKYFSKKELRLCHFLHTITFDTEQIQDKFCILQKSATRNTKNVSHSVYFSSKLNHLAVINTRVANLERSHFHGNTAIGYAEK